MKFKTQAITAALLFLITIQVSAQQPRARRPMEGRGGHGGPVGMSQGPSPIETALRMKTELKLSEAQVSQLEALRNEVVAQQQAQASKMIDVRSRVAAGLIQREEVRKEFEANRETLHKSADQRRERFQKILTDEQRTQLRERAHHHQMMGRKQHMRRGVNSR